MLLILATLIFFGTAFLAFLKLVTLAPFLQVLGSASY